MGAERLCCSGASPRTRLCCCGCGSQLQHLRDECVMAAAGSAGGLGARTISLQGSLLGSFLIKIWCQCLPISCCSQWQFAFAVSQHAQVSNGVGKEVISKERTWCLGVSCPLTLQCLKITSPKSSGGCQMCQLGTGRWVWELFLSVWHRLSLVPWDCCCWAVVCGCRGAQFTCFSFF